MGEVYRARDTRLGRDVAIKMLPDELTHDVDRLRRLRQEARTLASVRHPNVLAVYDIGETEPAYLVLELLEGDTLRARLARGPLRTRTAIEIAAQLARGLGAAHARSLVHRDLKPENVLLTIEGQAKILDFGLAKAVPANGTDVSTTLQSLQTAPGLMLGTVGYMAPEQVRGRSVDHRADVFALGAVLYEMLTGRRAFDGETAADVMTSILEKDPPELSLTPQLPQGLVRIVDRCLEKDAEARFRSADDLAFALEGLLDDRPSATTLPPPSAVRQKGPIAVAAFVVGAGLAAALLGTRSAPPASSEPVVRLQLTLPDDITIVRAQPPAVSPDGLRIAVVATDNTSGTRFVFLRSLNSLAAQRVGGTERATFPFWSSDGQRIAFFADGRLKTADLAAAGAVQDLGAVSAPVGPGIWAGDTIVFPTSSGPLRRVSASRGGQALAAPLDARAPVNQLAAGFLTDGQRFVFMEGRGLLPSIWLAAPDGSRLAVANEGPRGLIDAPWRTTAGATDGRLLFIRDSRLLAVHLAGDTGQISGESTTIAQPVYPVSASGAFPFSVQAKVIAYVGNANVESRIVWLNRRGDVLGQVSDLQGYLRDISLSPDGSLAVVTRLRESYELTLVNVGRSTTSRLAEGANALQASWTPDQSAIVFTDAQPAGTRIMRVAPREGAAAAPLLPNDTGRTTGPSITSDGHTLVYARILPDGSGDVYSRRLATGIDHPIVASPADEPAGRLSPDARWIAYHSNETGSPEVFIRSFPSGDIKQQVSRGGGYRSVWRRDGRELFYISPDGDLMAASIALSTSLQVGTPIKLFRTPIDPGSAVSHSQFDVHPDNERFLMVVPVANTPHPIDVILNWRSLQP